MKFIIFLFSALLTLSSYAQPNLDNNKKDYTPPMFLRAVGISFQSFDGLNSRIANRPEYKELRDYAGTLDFGFIREYNRFVSDLDLTAGSSMSGDRDKKSSTIRYAGIGIDLGYDLLASKKLLLYPSVGIGGEAYQARFYKDNSLVPFDAVLVSSDVQNAIRPVNFTNRFFTYRLGLGFAVRPSNNASGYMGIRAAYMGSFKDKEWKSSDNQSLAGAPSDGLSQFSISLVIMNMPMMMKWK